MKQRRRLFLMALAALAVTGVSAAPAHARAQAPDLSPDAVAAAYLQARSAAVTGGDPAGPLALWIAPGSGLVARERLIARGTGLNAASLGHLVDDVDTVVSIGNVELSADGRSATVAAHAISTTRWHSTDAQPDTEATGLDHVLTLVDTNRGWRVAADSYLDVMVPGYLEEAGAPPVMTDKALRHTEAASAAPAPRTRIRAGDLRRRIRRAGAARAGRGYNDIITYQRDNAVTYADKYCLSYNSRVVRFGADCANFASQCAASGGMPTNPGAWDTGWWYRNSSTSTPSDDSYSLSWINVGKQQGFWSGLRTDWVTGVSGLGRGDMVYYDWSGDGAWDHVAVVVGSNSAGQKVIDAHTTDHYRVYWKLGSSSTKYRFARVRAQWLVV